MTLSPALRKLLSLGSGVGIEIGARDLSVSAVQVRPTGVRVLAAREIADYRNRPAAEWGAELAGYLREAGVGHVAATVLLPRAEVIVRQVQLPGVADKDVASALAYQVDALHPYGEDEAEYGWARLGQSAYFVVAIVRREVVERFAGLFGEAGIRVASFTCSAVALYSGARLLNEPPEGGFLALLEEESGAYEAYGESAARPLFSASFQMPVERVRAFATSELRLPAEQSALSVAAILPVPRTAPEGVELKALPYAAGLAGACPWLGLAVNLLPAAMRHSSSRMRYVPTAALGTLLVLMAAALAVEAGWEDRRYAAALQSEMVKLQPLVRQAEAMEGRTATARRRTALLDAFRRRSTADMDVLKEATKLLPPPLWLNSIEITRTTVTFGGEAEQAAGLLKVLDASPLFEHSDFSQGIQRVGAMESFHIRTTREEPKR